MTALSDFITAQTAFNAQMDTAIADITTEMTTLNATITTLQNSAGALSPADQASLDTLSTHAQSVVAKLAALDTLNPPAA